jgi:hypothetical protein
MGQPDAIDLQAGEKFDNSRGKTIKREFAHTLEF